MNNRDAVADKSAKKIEAVLAENEYYPNKLTTAIFKGHSNDIALIVQNMMNPFFSQLVTEIELVVEETNYNLIICNCHGDAEIEKRYFKNLLENRIAGLIVINTNDESIYENKEIPIIGVEKRILDYPKVAINNEKAIKEMINNLELDDKKVLMCHGPNSNYSSHSRTQYVSKYTKGICDSIDFYELSDDVNQLNKTVDVDLKSYDIVICWCDVVAHKIYGDAIKNGLKIPSDLEIVGFDGLFMNQIFGYHLTTMNQGIQQIGKCSIYNLIDLIKGLDVSDQYIDAKFIKGNTSN